MRQDSYKPKMPDLMEAIFDAGYLIFDLIAAILYHFNVRMETDLPRI